MSSTQVLPAVAHAATTEPPEPRVWEVDLDRCAVEVRIGARLPIWRARLRVISARLTLPTGDNHSVAEGLALLSAAVAVGPVIASVPATRTWFLPGTPRSHHLLVAGSGPVLAAGQGLSARLDTVITTPDASWRADVTLHADEVDEPRLVVSLRGAVPRSRGPFPGAAVHVDAAAELVRCR